MAGWSQLCLVTMTKRSVMATQRDWWLPLSWASASEGGPWSMPVFLTLPGPCLEDSMFPMAAFHSGKWHYLWSVSQWALSAANRAWWFRHCRHGTCTYYNSGALPHLCLTAFPQVANGLQHFRLRGWLSDFNWKKILKGTFKWSQPPTSLFTPSQHFPEWPTAKPIARTSGASIHTFTRLLENCLSGTLAFVFLVVVDSLPVKRTMSQPLTFFRHLPCPSGFWIPEN